MTELSPCPFCGYALPLDEGLCIAKLDEFGDELSEAEWRYTGICCSNCAAFVVGDSMSRDSAITAWNRRSPEGEVTEAEVEAAAQAALLALHKRVLTAKRDHVFVIQGSDFNVFLDALLNGAIAIEKAARRTHRDTPGEVVDAAKALLVKLDEVHADPRYQAVWTLARIHSAPYGGPTYTEEVAALRSALSDRPGLEHK